MDSIIFDLDGTLWDPIESVLEAWNRVIIENSKLKDGLTREHLEKTMGLQMKEIGQQLFPELDEDEREQFLNDLSTHEIAHLQDHGGQLYNNVEEVLDRLSKKYKLFIVSNCQAGYIEAFYKYHGLDRYFIDYENPGRTGLSKAENIKLIMSRNNLKDPVYVGDTEGDRQAAKEAGIPFIYASYGFGEVSGEDEKIDGLDELLRRF
ncbi:HAD family hydrolase [Bacillus sp. KH172YL63]|uniref:HAD family hydrolase n=1 Tax=Bacillus sp. KH172YL63 TaxID=2709784 RepID=UPI0013E4C046|nr:HAD family hydrolase [Bacillus sp. KH172YL63]BCB03915.1 haloacid dehalogenase [Bacillus sp. KH172YL63]